MRRLVIPSLLAAVLALVVGPSPVRGGEPAMESAPTPSNRAIALEASIRHLERHLAHLRKARRELAAGRPEPATEDDVARRALNEVHRYEAARAKALDRVDDAHADEGTRAEARSRVDALDAAFVETVKRLDDAAAKEPRDAKEGAKKPDADGEK
jgi:hypothetical protein